MSNETMFLELCKIMARLEDVINSFTDIGFIVEPGTKGTVSENLYVAASDAYRIAVTLLDIPDVETENDICNELLCTSSETVEEVSKRIWTQYGIKSNIQ